MKKSAKGPDKGKEVKHKKAALKPKVGRKTPGKDSKNDVTINNNRKDDITFAAESISYINAKESHEINNESELIHGHRNSSIEKEETDKFEFGFSFSAQEGELGDESEDTGDLPDSLDQVGNRYNPTLSTGEKRNKDFDEIIDGIHITDGHRLGIDPEDEDKDAFSDEDEN